MSSPNKADWKRKKKKKKKKNCSNHFKLIIIPLAIISGLINLQPRLQWLLQWWPDTRGDLMDWADRDWWDMQVDWKTGQSATWSTLTIRQCVYAGVKSVCMLGCTCAMHLLIVCECPYSKVLCLWWYAGYEFMQLCFVCVCLCAFISFHLSGDICF